MSDGSSKSSILNDILRMAAEPDAPQVVDPHALARRDMQKSFPKRFWKDVAIEARPEGFVVLLDGRPLRTPAKTLVALPTPAAAEMVAQEWRGLGEVVDPSVMPVTRIVNSALDGVAKEMEAVAADLVKYAGSDLLCYRAADPERLVARQIENWNPVLDWMHERFGARFVLAEGVMFQAQPERTLAAVRDEVAKIASPLALASLHVITTLTGSVVLALAVAQGRLAPAEAWAAAHLDEDFQMEVWGEDEEALVRRALRHKDFEAAAAMHAAVAG